LYQLFFSLKILQISSGCSGGELTQDTSKNGKRIAALKEFFWII